MSNTLRYLTLLGKLVGLVGAFSAIPGLDPHIATLLFLVSSVVKDVVNRVGDWADDGKPNGSFHLPGSGPTATALLVVGVGLLVGGCSVNRVAFADKDQGGKVRELHATTWALWPATTELAKQRVTSSPTRGFSVGTDGLREETGGTNMVEALKALDSILGKVRP